MLFSIVSNAISVSSAKFQVTRFPKIWKFSSKSRPKIEVINWDQKLSLYGKSKSNRLSQWVSQWQGHLLSCSGQLKNPKTTSSQAPRCASWKADKLTSKQINKLINWQAQNLQAIRLTDEKKIWWQDEKMTWWNGNN